MPTSLPCGCVLGDTPWRCETARALTELADASRRALFAAPRGEVCRRCSLVHHANLRALGAHLTERNRPHPCGPRPETRSRTPGLLLRG